MFSPTGATTSLRTVLELEIFTRAQSFVATARADLDRPVRWVHASEIADISRFLIGGEVLLTAGMGIGQTEEEQRAYVGSIADVGVAALAVELTGRAFDAFPPAVIDEAEQRGLALIGLRREVPFVEVSAQVLRQLTDSTLEEYSRTVDLNAALSEHLVAEADYIDIVEFISYALKRPVVLESADHAVRAYFGTPEQADPVLAEWQRHAESKSLHTPSQQHEQPDCLRRPIVVQGATWGWLHLPLGYRPTVLERVFFEQGAAAIAISLLNERVSSARSDHQEAILMSRLLLGDIEGPAFVEQAARLGKDLAGTRLCVVILGGDHPEGPDFKDNVRRELARVKVTVLTAEVEGAYAVVASLPNDRAREAMVSVLRADHRHLGYSNEVTADELGMAVEQARQAYSVRGPAQSYEGLGLLRLLLPLADDPRLRTFVADEIGGLLDHDRTRGTDLCATLATFLECDGNKSTAAKALFVQRRTLYYRLEKISQILGIDVESTEARLRLGVALRAADLLRP